eukprot:2791794-Rhodomonas_salina.2
MVYRHAALTSPLSRLAQHGGVPIDRRAGECGRRSCSKHRESDEVNLRKEKELQRLALFNAPVALVRRAQTLRREFSLRSASDGVAPAVSGESMEAASHHDRGAPAQAQAGSRMAQRPGASESL